MDIRKIRKHDWSVKQMTEFSKYFKKALRKKKVESKTSRSKHRKLGL